MITTNDYKSETNAIVKMKYSIILFVFIALLNVWLYIYNYYLEWEVKNVEQSISKIESSISEINSDEKVKLYTLIKANSKTLEKFSYLSNIPEYINTLKELSKTYSISFEWFNYSNSNLNTTVISMDDWVSLGYQKSQKFISNFRAPRSIWNKEIFSLWFIDAFEWQNQMKFNVKFTLK